MSLAKVIFKEAPTKEFEVMGKKIVVRGLTTRDTIEMDIDFEAMSNSNGGDIKLILKNIIEMLASTLVSIDGQTPDNRADAKEFLLNQEQEVVMEIFKQSDLFGTKATEEIKK
jgi:hypothetical protein